jgi:hypothetical protein
VKAVALVARDSTTVPHKLLPTYHVSFNNTCRKHNPPKLTSVVWIHSQSADAIRSTHVAHAITAGHYYWPHYKVIGGRTPRTLKQHPPHEQAWRHLDSPTINLTPYQSYLALQPFLRCGSNMDH